MDNQNPIDLREHEMSPAKETSKIQGSKGWAGNHVRICKLGGDTSINTVANIKLDQGVVVCDDDECLALWVEQGIRGRPDQPLLFPKINTIGIPCPLLEFP